MIYNESLDQTELAKEAISYLPEDLELVFGEILSQNTPEEFDAAQVRFAVRKITLQTYEGQPEHLQSRISSVFSNSHEISTDTPILIDTTKDDVKVDALLKSLEYVSLQKELDQWAGDDANRKEAAARIQHFISDASCTELDLSKLNLSSLPDIFDYSEIMSRLENLKLSFNSLRLLPNSLEYLDKLTDLDLSHNNIPFIPLFLGLLSSLKNLDLSCLPLQSFPDIFEYTELKTQIRSLNLSSTSIERLPEYIGELENLTN